MGVRFKLFYKNDKCMQRDLFMMVKFTMEKKSDEIL